MLSLRCLSMPRMMPSNNHDKLRPRRKSGEKQPIGELAMSTRQVFSVDVSRTSDSPIPPICLYLHHITTQLPNTTPYLHPHTPNPSIVMARQRGGSAPRRPTAPAARPAPAPATQRHASTAAAPPQQAAPAAPTQQAQAPTPQGPGLFGQMASTAA
jgi:hypothetical protein